MSSFAIAGPSRLCLRASIHHPSPLAVRPFSSTPCCSSGSSKWSKIRHKKAILDAARSNTFGRLTSEIGAAIRANGPSPDTNARLAMCLRKAKELSFPKDRLEATLAKAIKQLSGGEGMQTVTYEALGPDGVAMIIECATDSPGRTHARIKEIFNKPAMNGGARVGSVSHLFERKGVVRVALAAGGKTFDEVFEMALENGAEEVREVEEPESDAEEKVLEENGLVVEILCEPVAIGSISQALKEGQVGTILEAEQRMLPTTPPLRIDDGERKGGEDGTEWISTETVQKMDKLVDFLQENADCSKVW